MPSFDLVSSLDMGELKNVVNMANKQISGRYDFKGSKCAIELKGEQEMEIIAETESRIEAAMQILFGNMSKRNLGLKCLDVQKVEPTGHQMYKLKIRTLAQQDVQEIINYYDIINQNITNRFLEKL